MYALDSTHQTDRFCVLKQADIESSLLLPDNISSSKSWTMRLSKINHDVYIQGDNSTGVLGVHPSEQSLFPKMRYSHRLSKMELVHISSGTSHCVGITKAGRVITWGSNESGQCGRKEGVSCSIAPIESIGGVVQTACGYAHSVALTTSGEIYAWGLNIHGQLGTGSAKCERRPKRVFTRTAPLCIAAGGFFSMFLDSKGSIFYTGLTPVNDGVRSFIGRIELPSLLPRVISNICVVNRTLLVYTNPEVVSISPIFLFESNQELLVFEITVTSGRADNLVFTFRSEGGELYPLKIIETKVVHSQSFCVIKAVCDSSLSHGVHSLVSSIPQHEPLSFCIIPRNILSDTSRNLVLRTNISELISLELARADFPNHLDLTAVIYSNSSTFEFRTAATVKRNIMSFYSPFVEMNNIQNSRFFLKLFLGVSCYESQIEVVFWNARILSNHISQERTVAEIDVTMNHSNYLPSLKRWRWLFGTEFAISDPDSKNTGSSAIVTLIYPAKVDDALEISVSADDGANWSRLGIDNKKEPEFLS